MNEQQNNETVLNDLPDAVVHTKKRQFSIVWIVPLVAVIIGGWLIYKALSEKGLTINITFNSAEGLEAGKTKIKYKDVELGQVEHITLSPNLSQVVVSAQLDKEAGKHLSENSSFWVVRARIAVGGISDLGTIFSGAYIEVDFGEPGKRTLHFKGLEEPPIVTTGLPGRHFILEADRRGSLDIGSAVYYRQIKVGQIVAYQLAPDGRMITFKIFVHAPYHNYVRKNTHFWNASGLDVSLDAKGIRIDTESLATLIVGGIAFDVPKNTRPGDPSEEEEVFILYNSFEESQQKTYIVKTKWVLNFGGSVRGLSPGAPVEFRGIQIGKVYDIKASLNLKDLSFKIPVIIELEPGRLIPDFDNIEDTENKNVKKVHGNVKAMEYFVAKGLRAQLKTGSIITGQKYVDFDFYPDAPVRRVNLEGIHPEIPTLPTTIEEMGAKITKILAKLEKLPVEQIGNDLRDTVQNAKRFTHALEEKETVEHLNTTLQEAQQLVATLRKNAVPEITSALKQAQKSLAAAEAILSSNSTLQHKIKIALDELAGAARSIRILTNYLEQHPDALVFGKGKQNED